MRILKIIFIVALLLFLLVAPVFAQEADNYTDVQLAASWAKQLPDTLPSETRDLLRDIGVEGVDFYRIFETSPRAVLDMLLGLLRGKAAVPLKAAIKAIGIVLLLAVAESFAPKDDKTQAALLLTGGALLVVSVAAPLSGMLSAAASAIQLSADFMLALIPVLAAVITISGNPMLALSYNSYAFAAAQGVSQLARGFVLPFTGIFLATGIADALAPTFHLRALTATLQKTAAGVLSAAAALFAALLSLKGVMANTADTLAARGVKLLLKSAIPVVGDALSEAYASIAGSLALLKVSVAVFGILAVALINLPILLELLLWMLCMKAAGLCAGILGLNSVENLLASLVSALLLLSVLLLFGAVLFILATGLMLAIRVDM